MSTMAGAGTLHSRKTPNSERHRSRQEVAASTRDVSWDTAGGESGSTKCTCSSCARRPWPIAEALPAGVSTQMDVVGVDTLAGEVQRLACRLGLDNHVRFMGLMTQRERRPLMHSAECPVPRGQLVAGVGRSADCCDLVVASRCADDEYAFLVKSGSF